MVTSHNCKNDADREWDRSGEGVTNDETIVLRVTVIGDQSYADDFTVIWRGLPIGRIMPPTGPAASRHAMAVDLQRLRQARWRGRLRSRRLQDAVSCHVGQCQGRADRGRHREGAGNATGVRAVAQR